MWMSLAFCVHFNCWCIIKFNLDPSGFRTCWPSNKEAELPDGMLQRWLRWTDHLQQPGICRFTAEMKAAEIRFPLWSENYSGFKWLNDRKTVIFLLNIVNRICWQQSQSESWGRLEESGSISLFFLHPVCVCSVLEGFVISLLCTLILWYHQIRPNPCRIKTPLWAPLL